MPETLNTETALAYAKRIMRVGVEDGQATFGEPALGNDLGVPFVSIPLFNCGRPNGTFEVWVEGGKLYGEW